MFSETPTRIYLQKTRNISVEIPPLTIRHHLGAPHPYENGLHHAMVCRVWKWDENSLCGVHITYLNAEGTKADFTPNKIMRGKIKGAGVWFGDPTDKLNIAEGVETALSVFEMTGVATVAALSTSNMAALVLPETVKHVTIAADHDVPGMKAAQAAATNFIQLGLKTQITVPPNKGDDWNDILQRQAGRCAA